MDEKNTEFVEKKLAAEKKTTAALLKMLADADTSPDVALASLLHAATLVASEAPERLHDPIQIMFAAATTAVIAKHERGKSDKSESESVPFDDSAFANAPVC